MSKIAVAGAGPAGIAAAIQLERAGHEVTVFEPSRIGGNLWNAGFVENFPGFPGGITGRNLAELMEEQFNTHGFQVSNARVKEIRKQESGYLVISDSEAVFDGVIICTGTVPKKAGFPGEEELAIAGFLRYGIYGLRNLPESGDALVIGGGESSMDMTLSLAEMEQNVVLLHRSELRGIKMLLDAIADEDFVSLLEGTVVGARIHGEKAVVQIETSSGKEEKPFDLALVAVGREPRRPTLVGIDIDNPPPGFRIAGDARHGGLGQTAMAVGDGVRAAMEVGRELQK
jgi:thioredoxin reductase (NADPH)